MFIFIVHWLECVLMPEIIRPSSVIWFFSVPFRFAHFGQPSFFLIHPLECLNASFLSEFLWHYQPSNTKIYIYKKKQRNEHKKRIIRIMYNNNITTATTTSEISAPAMKQKTNQQWMFVKIMMYYRIMVQTDSRIIKRSKCSPRKKSETVREKKQTNKIEEYLFCIISSPGFITSLVSLIRR